MYTFSLFMWHVGRSQLNSGASSLEAERCLLGYSRGCNPKRSWQDRPWLGGSWSTAAGRAEVPSSVPFSGLGKSLLGGSGKFLIVYISGLRNTNFFSEEKLLNK